MLRLSLHPTGAVTPSEFFDANGIPRDGRVEFLSEAQNFVQREIARLRDAGANGLELRAAKGWFTGMVSLAGTVEILHGNVLARIKAREAKTPPALDS